MNIGIRGEPDPVGRAKTEAAKIATLTAREREVIALVGDGLKDKQIAQRLSITAEEVNHNLASSSGKLGVSDRLELLFYAYHNGLACIPGGEETDVRT